MTENNQQPRPDDAVLGGNSPEISKALRFNSNEHQILESLNDDDVIEFISELVKVSTLKAALKKTLESQNNQNTISHSIGSSLRSQLSIKSECIPRDGWLDNGIQCRFLKPGSFWKKGKIKISVNVEFYPDSSKNSTNI